MKADYIGWAKHGNLGDDACLEAIRRLCAPLVIEQTKLPATGLCILGGGTLIYGEAFLRPACRALGQGARIVVLGSGVDLGSPLEEWEPERRRAWSELLSRASVVGVRGPESLRAVRQLGARQPTVLGDPALALATARPRRGDDDDHHHHHHHRNLVLLNAGSDFPPDGGRQSLEDVLAEAVAWLRGAGMRVEYLPLRPNDLIHGRALIESCGLSVVEHGLSAALERVRRAHLVISLRLHGAVFAAGCGVPFVSLAYQPKCRDFAGSVRMSHLCLQTATLDFARLRQAVRMIETHYAATARRLAAVCNEYRRRLRVAAAQVVRWGEST